MTLAERLRATFALTPETPPLAGDDWPFPGAFTPAAVLIAITDRPEPGLILTRRQASLRRHAGQIAFPGGRVDPEDDGPIAAALREAHEEIALDPATVSLVGSVEPYRTGSGYAVVPVIGVIPPDLPLAPHEAEVAAVFEVPLAFVTDPVNQIQRTRDMEGRDRRFYEISWGEHHIWGITAALIVNLGRRLRAAA